MQNPTKPKTLYIIKQKNKQLVASRLGIRSFVGLVDASKSDSNLLRIVSKYQRILQFVEEYLENNMLNIEEILIVLSTTSYSTKASIDSKNKRFSLSFPVWDFDPDNDISAVENSILNMIGWIVSYDKYYSKAILNPMYHSQSAEADNRKSKQNVIVERAKVKNLWVTSNIPSTTNLITGKITPFNNKDSHINPQIDEQSVQNDINSSNDYEVKFYDRADKQTSPLYYPYAQELLNYLAQEYAIAVELIGYKAPLLIEFRTKVRANRKALATYLYGDRKREICVYLTHREDNSIWVSLNRIKSSLVHELGHYVHYELYKSESLGGLYPKHKTWSHVKKERFAQRYTKFRGHNVLNVDDSYMREVDGLFKSKGVAIIDKTESPYDTDMQAVMGLFYSFIKTTEIENLQGMTRAEAVNRTMRMKKLLEDAESIKAN